MSTNTDAAFSMANLEIHSLLRDLIRNVWVIVLAGLIGYMGVYVAGHSVYKPTYTSSATLVVSAKSGTSSAYSNLSMANQMADVFTKVFTDDILKSRVAERLGQTAFDGTISASMVTNTNIFQLSVTAQSPRKAYMLLKTVLNVYPEISDYLFANAVVDVMNPPEMPSSPSSSLNNSGTEKKAAVLCAALMTVLVLLISFLRDTVKNEHAFREKVEGKLLGSIPHERKYHTLRSLLAHKNRSILIDNPLSSFGFTESFHKLATRLAYAHHSDGVHVFLVTSVMENEGKSSVAANLALSLAQRGRSVLLMEADLRKPALHKIFADRPRKPVTFAPGEIPEGYTILKMDSTDLTLAVYPQRRPDSAEFAASPVIRDFVENMRRRYDYVLMDTPPMDSVSDAEAMLPLADAAIMVVRTDYAYAADINDAMESLNAAAKKTLGCILNDTRAPIMGFSAQGADSYSGYGYGHFGRYGRYGRYEKTAAAGGEAEGGNRHE